VTNLEIRTGKKTIQDRTIYEDALFCNPLARNGFNQ
jgi:hypothetical protein